MLTPAEYGGAGEASGPFPAVTNRTTGLTNPSKLGSTSRRNSLTSRPIVRLTLSATRKTPIPVRRSSGTRSDG